MSTETKCDLCGSTQRWPLTNEARDGKVRNVVCIGCGLVYVHPKPTLEFTRDIYASGEFGAGARGPGPPSTAKVHASESKAVERVRRLQALDLLDVSPRRALDIGCGLGSSLWLLRAFGFHGVGLEPDPEYSTSGTAMYDVEIWQDRYEDWTFTDHEFGLIFASHVLEHVDSPSEFTDKLAADLAPAGVAYIEVPSITRPYGGDLQSFFWSAHLTSFSPATLEALLAKHGLRIRHAGWSDHFYWAVVGHGEQTAPDLPVENPLRVWTRLNATRLKFRTGQQLPQSLSERSRYLRGIARWAKEDPGGFGEVAIRKVRGAVASPSSCLHAVHVGHHHPGNAGDTVLFQATRDLWSQFVSRTEWTKYEIGGGVDHRQLSDIDRADAVLVGGGGLFLRDTNPNQESGWQWAIPRRSLEELSTPLVVWAVGYNRFRGHPEFIEEFTENLNNLVVKSAFFGLRNSGSVRAIREYLRPDLRDRVIYQPCPTVHLSRIYAAGETRSAFEQGAMTVTLNGAFDRRLLRFGSPTEEDRILREAATAMKEITRRGWKLTVAVHLPTDWAVTPWLEAANVNFKVADLYRQPTEAVVQFYRGQALTLGMRGHSQMIPFGLQNSIVSLISHDKLGWFLEDICHPEWGAEVREPHLDERLIALIETITECSATTLASLKEAEMRLWETTSQNLESLREKLVVEA